MTINDFDSPVFITSSLCDIKKQKTKKYSFNYLEIYWNTKKSLLQQVSDDKYWYYCYCY